jgi:hypothetical protein
VNWAVIFSVAVEFDDGFLVASLGAGVGNGLPVDDQEGGIRSLTINDSLLAIINPTKGKNSRRITAMEKSKSKSKVKCVFEKVNRAKRELARSIGDVANPDCKIHYTGSSEFGRLNYCHFRGASLPS